VEFGSIVSYRIVSCRKYKVPQPSVVELFVVVVAAVANEALYFFKVVVAMVDSR